MNETVLALALASNLSFALGSQIFTHYARRVSSLWMNTFKAGFALLAFGLTISLTSGWHSFEIYILASFLISGAIGLGLGDYFLLQAFSEIGPGRTLILFGFQPLIIGVASFFLFGQGIDTEKLWAIVFFILCLMVFSLEHFKKTRSWDFKGIVYAFLGMLLDGSGLILTRFAFDQNKMVTSFEGNFYRCLGAVLFFAVVGRRWPLRFWSSLKKLEGKGISAVVLGSFLGTFLSLACYLKALQSAHVASLSAISITGTIFSALFECIWQKRLPSSYLILAFLCFFAGMYILL